MLLGLYIALVVLGVLVIAVDDGMVMSIIVPDRYRDRLLAILLSVFLFLALTPVSWFWYWMKVYRLEETK